MKEGTRYLTTYAWKKVTIGVGHFQIIDYFYDWQVLWYVQTTITKFLGLWA